MEHRISVLYRRTGKPYESAQRGQLLTVVLQIEALQSNLKTANNIISSCPACKENFFNLFCTFTCSPDQSLFINITDVAESTSKKMVVTELDNLWSDKY